MICYCYNYYITVCFYSIFLSSVLLETLANCMSVRVEDMTENTTMKTFLQYSMDVSDRSDWPETLLVLGRI